MRNTSTSPLTTNAMPPAPQRSHALAWALCGLGVWVASAGSALAQQGGSESAINHFARQWIDETLNTNELQQATPLRPEVVIGNLDPRLQLAPCARIEPYLPRGTQLWGRSRVGLRCVEGPVAWNVFLPVTIKAWGPAWVVKQTVQANATLTAADAELAPEVDWAESRHAVIALPEHWVGMQAKFTLMPGQTLRQNAVRPPQVFAVGTQVRVTTAGVGFEMSATGQAMSTGYVGQQARVKLANGKLISGLVNKDGAIEVNI